MTDAQRITNVVKNCFNYDPENFERRAAKLLNEKYNINVAHLHDDQEAFKKAVREIQQLNSLMTEKKKTGRPARNGMPATRLMAFKVTEKEGEKLDRLAEKAGFASANIYVRNKILESEK